VKKSNSDQDESIGLAQSHLLPAAPVEFEQRAQIEFPVVGIGASAGGVEALSKFFRGASAHSGMAFVVIQHLAPDTQSFMVEILGRCTPMRVLQIEDGTRVAPDTVYVIRPGFTVTLAQGVLRLGQPVERRGHRRPVDDFFRSLALEQKEKAVIVILSGTGTNGTAGAQAIKAAGGLCIAQDPDTAEFPGMPRSLVHSGYADQVLPAENIAQFIVDYIHHPLIENPHERAESDSGAEELQRECQSLGEIQALLRMRTGHDFRGYRKPTLLRRIQRRMGIAGVTQLADYARRLRDRVDEAPALANDLMINVTGFFRDPDAWEALREGAVAPLVDQCPPGQPLRAWVTACASGEEAYSLAMLIAEECRRTRKPLEVKIFATDTADKSLALARAGVYPGGIEGDIAQERLDQFFDKDDHTYRIKKEIRDMVVFAPQNLLRDPPFSRVDICTCRNLLIYLEPETQKRVLSLLAFAIRDGGYLFLGNTENLGDTEAGFESVSRRWRIYRHIGPAQHRFVDVPYSPRLALQDAMDSQVPTRKVAAPPASAISYERALLDEFAPPSVVVDRQEHLLYVHGDTTSFLSYPAGELTNNLIEVTRPALRAAVRTAFRHAVERQVVVMVDSQLESDDSSLMVRVTAAPLKGRSAGRNLRISFELRPVTGLAKPSGEVAGPEDGTVASPFVLHADNGLEDEVRILRRELQASVEAFEANNEELKASNEEVLSVNEELQSANEELETSKEELQSLNEELTTVNSQLQAKILDFEHITNDLSNLLSSTSIAVVFLDTELLVRRFTLAVQDLIELIPTDIGRSISDLAPKFTAADGRETAHGTLRNTARAVLANLTPIETEVRSHSGRWYLHRTLPYRTADNHIEGVVLTFVDISARKVAEQTVSHMQARLQAALEQLPAAIIVADAPNGRIMHANRRVAELFGQTYPPAFLNAEWRAAVIAFRGRHPGGRLYAADEWPLTRSLMTGEVVVDEQMEVVGEGDVRRALSVSSAPVLDEREQIVAAVIAFWDVTRLKAAEQALRDSERRLRFVVENAQDFAILSLDLEGRITAWSTGAEGMFRWTEAEMLGQPATAVFTAADRNAGVPEQEMRTALQHGRANDERWHVRKDGTPLWVNGVLSLARDESGEVRGFVKVMRDDTEKKETQDRLFEATLAAKEAQANAETANRAKDDFISMISHELRTPLNTMRLWVRLLGHEALPEGDRAEGRRTLERAVISQQQLIDDLLDVSRIASGKLRLEVRPMRIAETIQTAIEAVRHISLRKEVEITLTVRTELGLVCADPDRLQQIVWNLLSNAVKFTPSGGRVAVDLDREGEWIVIRVTDTGIGITEDLLPHIFDRFLQGESGAARQHGGLGLGLAIAKQLVELHGGQISASSAGKGEGASFFVRLPLNLASEVPAAEWQPRQESSPSDLTGLHILLVEDEASAREGTRALLEAKGAHVQAVESADAARDARQARSHDMLISDIGLPGEDGYVLMQWMRSLEARQGGPRMPALALTAFARQEDRQRSLDAGYDAHMAKPVDPDKLVSEIGRLAVRRGA
jgi:two-component system, chemotaxis family, CheB/CheR fusion protein